MQTLVGEVHEYFMASFIYWRVFSLMGYMYLILLLTYAGESYEFMRNNKSWSRCQMNFERRVRIGSFTVVCRSSTQVLLQVYVGFASGCVFLFLNYIYGKERVALY